MARLVAPSTSSISRIASTPRCIHSMSRNMSCLLRQRCRDRHVPALTITARHPFPAAATDRPAVIGSGEHLPVHPAVLAVEAPLPRLAEEAEEDEERPELRAGLDFDAVRERGGTKPPLAGADAPAVMDAAGGDGVFNALATQRAAEALVRMIMVRAVVVAAQEAVQVRAHPQERTGHPARFLASALLPLAAQQIPAQHVRIILAADDEVGRPAHRARDQRIEV